MPGGLLAHSLTTHSFSINFLRLNILKVLQVTEKHLNKITSVDEFLRRIYAVIHSNDPIARAVTLRSGKLYRMYSCSMNILVLVCYSLVAEVCKYVQDFSLMQNVWLGGGKDQG